LILHHLVNCTTSNYYTKTAEKTQRELTTVGHRRRWSSRQGTVFFTVCWLHFRGNTRFSATHSIWSIISGSWVLSIQAPYFWN